VCSSDLHIFEVVFDIDPLVTEPDCSSTDTNIDTLDTMLDRHIVEPVEFKLMLGLFHFIFHIISSYYVLVFLFPIPIVTQFGSIFQVVFFYDFL